MFAPTKPRRHAAALDDGTLTHVATAYSEAGDDYIAYADGDPTRLYSFDARYGYCDRQVWKTLARKLEERRASGASSIRILDAGCGPGTWLRRIVTHAQALGFSAIEARGFDIAQAQIQRARLLAGNLARLPGVSLTFELGDLAQPLPESDRSIDLCLCLYGVLNHLPVPSLPATFAEMARVTDGHLFATVRAIGSTPTIFVDSLDKASGFKQDHDRGRIEIDLRDGRHLALSAHLFSASEIKTLIDEPLEIEDLRGLDLFHSRFAPDPRWNPASLAAPHPLDQELARLEEIYARDPRFIDRAAHLFLVARRAAPKV